MFYVTLLSTFARGAAEYRREMLPLITEIQTAGARTLRQIADELNVRGEVTRRGRPWTQTQVHRILNRQAEAA